MREYLTYHIIALVAGIILDWIVGDPYWMPHPIKLIGRMIGALDKAWMGPKENKSTNPKREKKLGILMCVIVVGSTIMLTTLVLILSYYINTTAGIVVEAILTCYILAAKSLCKESLKVYQSLKLETLKEARYAVSMIVGRDTDCLDETGVAKAAIETVAENTSDGIIAPLIYTAIGGPVLGLAYKAINTMDSMVGYHNDRYEHLGCIPARLDDVVNYLPSRISALMMIVAAAIIGIFNKKYNAMDGIKIWRRDRRNHKSPNSAQTESACAGILGIKLAGDASYFGHIVKKPTIGDEKRAIEFGDIIRANVLMFGTEAVCILIVLDIMALIVAAI